MKDFSYKQLCTLVLLVSFFVPGYVFASKPDVGDAPDTLLEFTSQTGASTRSLNEQVAIGIEFVYVVVGIIFFILALYGGILWMTAQGKEDQVAKGRNTLVAAIIGMAVVVGAYGITSLITSTVVQNIGNQDAVQRPRVPEQFGDGTTPTLGCCINVVRGDGRFRNISHTMMSQSECEIFQAEDGSDTDRGEDWEWYNVDPEQCVLIYNTCWDKGGNDSTRTAGAIAACVNEL